MLRTALQPRWLALLAGVLALATAFAALGGWQLDRAQRGDEAPGPAGPGPVVMDDVLRPQEALTGAAVAGPVVATGTYEPDRAVVVLDTELDGRRGAWVVVPLLVPAADAGGQPARLAVVLGWSEAAAEFDAAATLPAGPTQVVGRLQSSQAPSGPRDGLGPGELRSLSTADLVNDWGAPVYSAFLLAHQAPAGLAAVPPPPVEGGVDLLNVSYALQWWVFAGFAVFLWWRLVRDAHLREHDAGDADGWAAAPPGHTDETDEVRATRSEHA